MFFNVFAVLFDEFDGGKVVNRPRSVPSLGMKEITLANMGGSPGYQGFDLHWHIASEA